MYERFTDRARKVMQLANQEAQRFNHEYIGTEHILLGLVKEGSGVAANVLKNLGADVANIRSETEKLLRQGSDVITMAGKLPHTPRTRKVIEHAIEAARLLNCDFVGEEHLLLGLLREPDGVACQVLTSLGVTWDRAVEEVRSILGVPESPTPPPPEKVNAAGVVGWQCFAFAFTVSSPLTADQQRRIRAIVEEGHQAPAEQSSNPVSPPELPKPEEPKFREFL